MGVILRLRKLIKQSEKVRVVEMVTGTAGFHTAMEIHLVHHDHQTKPNTRQKY